MIDFADPIFKGVGPLILRIVTDTSRKWKIESEELLSEAMICFFQDIVPKHDPTRGALTTLTQLALSRCLHRYCKRTTTRASKQVRCDFAVAQIEEGGKGFEFPESFIAEVATKQKKTVTKSWVETRLKSYGWKRERIECELSTLAATYASEHQEVVLLTEEA